MKKLKALKPYRERKKRRRKRTNTVCHLSTLILAYLFIYPLRFVFLSFQSTPENGVQLRVGVSFQFHTTCFLPGFTSLRYFWKIMFFPFSTMARELRSPRFPTVQWTPCLHRRVETDVFCFNVIIILLLLLNKISVITCT